VWATCTTSWTKVGVFEDDLEHLREHTAGVVAELTHPEVDARKLPSRISAGLVPFLRYVNRCTDATDRLLVSGPYPDVFVLGRRGFAGGHFAFLEGFYNSDADQRASLERMQHQSVPFVVLPYDDQESFARSFPRILAHVMATYDVLTDVAVEETKGVRIMIERARPARRHRQRDRLAVLRAAASRSRCLVTATGDPAPRRRWVAASAIAGLFLATALLRYLSLNGFSNDHYQYLAGAQQMLLGELPTRDFVDPGQPLMYSVSAGSQILLGRTLFAEAVMTALAFGVAAACVAVIAWRISHSLVVGLIASVISVACVSVAVRISEGAVVCRSAARGMGMGAVALASTSDRAGIPRGDRVPLPP
jgi:hypothetical protein